MRWQTFILRPQTAFGTPLAGDTLFGQLCWALRYRLGVDRLTELLDGYVSGEPFMVVSDAFPAGYLPLPLLPGTMWEIREQTDLKALKARRWMPIKSLNEPLPRWQGSALSTAELNPLTITAQPHNSINRQTGTTGVDMFAPYTMTQRWYPADTELQVHVVYDKQRITPEELSQAFEYVGQVGFGRDASIGLGKFTVRLDANPLGEHVESQGQSFLCLGPCAPQGMGFDTERSFWQVITRFGRHGDVAAQSQNVFKKPLMLAKTGSVFSTEHDTQKQFIGQGLGGSQNPISWAIKETVHQGYSPVLPIQLPALAKQMTEVLP